MATSGIDRYKSGESYPETKDMKKKLQEDQSNTRVIAEPAKKTKKQFSDRIDNNIMLTQKEIRNMLTEFNPAEQLHIDDVIQAVGARRSGKSKIVEYMIHKYLEKNELDAVFLFSKSGAGFKNIPQVARFTDIKVLDQIIQIQLDVRAHNKKCHKKDRVKSRICAIIDDFIDSNHNDLKKSKTMVSLATKGRHISNTDKQKGNGMMVIFISQSFTAIPPVVRNNTDWTLTSAMANRLERKKLVESYFTLFSGRMGLSESYRCYDVACNSNPYQFAVINGTCGNKFDYDDYIFTYRAPEEDIPFQRWAHKDDEDVWQNNEEEIFFWADND